MGSFEANKIQAMRTSRQEIRNAGRHVLGVYNYSMCSTCFCRYTTKNKSQPSDAAHEYDEEDDDDRILNQCQFWQESVKDVTKEEEMAARRGGKKLGEVNEELLKYIFVILNRIADKADRLLGNFTLNLAESWMAIR